MSSKATVTWPHISAATKCEEPRYHRRGLQHRSPAPRTANEDCVMRTEKDKMLAGDLYDPAAPEIQADLASAHRWLARYNATLDMDPVERRALLVERFAAVGDGGVIRPPFHCDYCFKISLGAGVFMNYNCVILDENGRTTV